MTGSLMFGVQAEAGSPFRRAAVAYGIHTLNEMRTGRLELRRNLTSRQKRLCERGGHPPIRQVTLTHWEMRGKPPWTRYARRACARCGFHWEPEIVTHA